MVPPEPRIRYTFDGDCRSVAFDEPVHLGAGASQDPDGQIESYQWAFGDGATGSGSGPTPAHVYAAPGIYEAGLRVTDDSQTQTGTGCAIPGTSVIAARQAAANASYIASQKAVAIPVTLSVDDGTGLANATDSAVSEVRIHRPPTAAAEAPSLVCAGDVVLFNGTRAWDPDEGQLLCEWDFGDGSHGGGAQPTHLYERAGDYRVKLTVTGDQIGDCDNRNTDELRVEVLEAPRVEIQAPAAVAPDHEVRLSAVAPGDGTDPLPADLEARWDFGDGEQGAGAEVSHRYAMPGRYQVMLRVDDGRGGACSETRRLHSILVNAPPEAVAGSDTQVAAGEPLVFDASASTDPDGVIHSHRWDFGDGLLRSNGQPADRSEGHQECVHRRSTRLSRTTAGPPLTTRGQPVTPRRCATGRAQGPSRELASRWPGFITHSPLPLIRTDVLASGSSARAFEKRR